MIVLLNFFELQTSAYYNWILVNFILNITKRPDLDVTSGKARENHTTCEPFANFVKWKIWKRRTLCLNYSRYRFPRLWVWNLMMDRSTWLVFDFVFSLHWIGAAQRPSFINQFIVVVVVVVVQWKAARCRIHLRPVMVSCGLPKVLRAVKALQTHKKSANGFENLLL